MATGTVNKLIPKDVEKENRKKVELIFSINIATPVKPLDNKSAGLINTWITNACMKAATITQTSVRRKRIFLFFLKFFIFINYSQSFLQDQGKQHHNHFHVENLHKHKKHDFLKL